MKARREKQLLRESIRNVKTWLSIPKLSREQRMIIYRYIVTMQNKLKKK